jgi:hypothetical protein
MAQTQTRTKISALFVIALLLLTASGAQETTDWKGELPRNGDYVIVVGGTRGNATYTLEVTVR